MTCQLGAGCIYHEGAGACPLCDEDGADRIAEFCANERYHVVPVNDLREHSTESDKPCWCHPETTEDDIIVHNSMDQRERYETGERKMS